MNAEINKQMKLSQHFTLGELCKTSVKTADGNIPSHVHIENLKRLTGWLETLRDEWNRRYGDGDDPIIINSGYRSPQVNKAVGGAQNSNHLTGCGGTLDGTAHGLPCQTHRPASSRASRGNLSWHP